MAQPATTSPPAASVAERDALLATKLHVPRPQPGFVPRSRLLERLAEALALAAPGGDLQGFVDQGRPMAVLVGKLATMPAAGRAAAAQVPRPFLERLVGAFARSGLPVPARSRRGGTTVPGLVEPLTARELEVLGLLAAGLPNQAIAEELVITLDTVKRHVSHILEKEKLAATNRTQAVTRARELELLP